MKRRNFIRLAAGVCVTPFFNIGNVAYAGSYLRTTYRKGWEISV